jgi:tRNA-2-methylthio-N6-dimethylallyladenosine synthase
MVRHSDPVRAWVTIIEGCNEFCSFCVVPYTRGHERMRPAAEILAEVRHAASTGHREVQLLGQIVNHYQFASPHPRHVSDALIRAFVELPKLCRHLHLPLQSGSDRMLVSMRRRHTAEHYLRLVDRLRSAVPGIAISTDLIVGFPGETDDDFEATMDVVRQVRYHSIFSFKYSPRPNTLARKRLPDDVPEAEKTRRIVALQSLQRDLQLERFTRAVGSIEDVLIDSISRRRSSDVAGRTSGNTVVNLRGPAEWLGQILPVRITEASPNSLRGEALTPGGQGGQ